MKARVCHRSCGAPPTAASPSSIWGGATPQAWTTVKTGRPPRPAPGLPLHAHLSPDAAPGLRCLCEARTPAHRAQRCWMPQRPLDPSPSNPAQWAQQGNPENAPNEALARQPAGVPAPVPRARTQLPANADPGAVLMALLVGEAGAEPDPGYRRRLEWTRCSLERTATAHARDTSTGVKVPGRDGGSGSQGPPQRQAGSVHSPQGPQGNGLPPQSRGPRDKAVVANTLGNPESGPSETSHTPHATPSPMPCASPGLQRWHCGALREGTRRCGRPGCSTSNPASCHAP